MTEEHKQLIETLTSSLFSNLSQRLTHEEMDRIISAYEFARMAHEGQFRKSGLPYISHPISVAMIIAEEMELDVNTIMAAFLHDVVEDTEYTIEDIESRFGEDVAHLVAVVTKNKSADKKHSKQIANYRQILTSVQYDVRALLIKLADRLHNMRTLESMAPAKKMKIAGETDYFYAPLANRLGLYRIKRELENLSFKYRSPREYQELESSVNFYKENSGPGIVKFAASIQQHLAEADVNVRTEIRYRTPYSLWRKMCVDGRDFDHVEVKHYIRVIYDIDPDSFWTEKDLSLKIYSVLSDNFKERPGSIVNYIDAPKENGYQSFHFTLLNDEGGWEEIHVSSERMLRNARIGCAAEKSSSFWIEKFRGLLKELANSADGDDFMESVKASFYPEDVLVHTPKGKIIILPQGATAIDFAFEIHSDVGRHAEVARINGVIKSVKTELRRGDCVDIQTNPNLLPEPDWINHVKTAKAKKALRMLNATVPKIKYTRCPVCHPLPGEEVVAFKEPDGSEVLHTRNCAIAIRRASEHGEDIIDAVFESNDKLLYPVCLDLRGVDRYHLLSDLVEGIADKQKLCMTHLSINTIDRIATCRVEFMVHSMTELNAIISYFKKIPSVDEVKLVTANNSTI